MVCGMLFLWEVSGKMKQYRISEFAKRMCVSLDFIRFYENKGLIQATIDAKNGYHYYDVSQSEAIYLIQQYRRLGCSVNEVVELMQNSNLAQLQQKCAALAQTHRETMKTSRYATHYLEKMQDALASPNGTWYISRVPAIWFLPHTDGDDYLQDPAYTDAYRDWVEHAPLFFSLDKWELRADGTLKAIRHGRALECSVAEDFGFAPGAAAERYPQKRCLEYYLDSTDFGSSLGLRNLQPAFDIIREKDFRVDGDAFLRHIAFYTEYGQPHNRFIVYIPIQ